MLQAICRFCVFICLGVSLACAADFNIKNYANNLELSNGELVVVLESGNYEKSVKLFNRIKNMQYAGHLIPILTRLWSGGAVANINPSFIANPRIKIELADVLLQMHRNGFGGLTATAYENYARSLTKSDDPDVARQAILVLGIASNPNDIKLLGDIFSDPSSGHWRAAALGLVGNCAMSESTIERMARGATVERGRFLRGTWVSQKGLRNC